MALVKHELRRRRRRRRKNGIEEEGSHSQAMYKLHLQSKRIVRTPTTVETEGNDKQYTTIRMRMWTWCVRRMHAINSILLSQHSLTHSLTRVQIGNRRRREDWLIEATRMIALCVRNECQPARTITNPIYYADENERIEHMFPDSPIQKKRISIKMHEILLALLLHLHLHVSFAYIESFHFKWNTRRRKSTNDSASAAEK